MIFWALRGSSLSHLLSFWEDFHLILLFLCELHLSELYLINWTVHCVVDNLSPILSLSHAEVVLLHLAFVLLSLKHGLLRYELSHDRENVKLGILVSIIGNACGWFKVFETLILRNYWRHFSIVKHSLWLCMWDDVITHLVLQDSLAVHIGWIFRNLLSIHRMRGTLLMRTWSIRVGDLANRAICSCKILTSEVIVIWRQDVCEVDLLLSVVTQLTVLWRSKAMHLLVNDEHFAHSWLALIGEEAASFGHELGVMTRRNLDLWSGRGCGIVEYKLRHELVVSYARSIISDFEVVSNLLLFCLSSVLWFVDLCAISSCITTSEQNHGTI